MANLQSVNSVAGKETIYVDVDDEITAIIDKVGVAKGKIVALVLPKRCPVLQSVVNMKLLKRSADNAGKNLVLITSEAGLMPLAGATGLYVASSPTSKPVIPTGPNPADDLPEDIEEPLKIVDGNAGDSDDDDFDTKSSSGKSVGELNSGVKKSTLTPADDDMINMADDADEAVQAPIVPTAKLPKQKKNKSLKVPNFDSFRVLMVIGAVILILIIAGVVVALNVLPKAVITIGTDSNTIPTNLTLTLDTNATSLDPTNDIVPATAQTQQKTNSATVQATGQQNNGQKASGTVTLNQNVCAPNLGQQPNPVQAGATVSSGNSTFVVQQNASYSPTSHYPNGNCQTWTTGSINILALNGGSSYNISDGSSFSGPDSATGTGSASGGTDNITTVVQQSDITNAQNKAASIDSSTVKNELEQSLEAVGLTPITATFLAGSPQTNTNQQVGAAAGNVTATTTISYSMMGVKKSDLQTLVDNNVNGQLDKGKQVILNDGISNAQYGEPNPGTASSATITMSASSQVGPQLNVTALKTQLAGMKERDVQSYIKQTPGVTNVSVKYSPFWVDSVPSKPNKVQINIVKAGS